MIELSGYQTVLLFLIGGVGFVMVTLLVGRILRPVRPNEEKLTTYESGEDPVNSAWRAFNPRFYIIALIFILFEAELVFLFPWAIVFGDAERHAATDGLWGKFALIETFIFIGILLVGLIYVWTKGMLDWVKPDQKPSTYKSRIPKDAYQHLKKD